MASDNLLFFACVPSQKLKSLGAKTRYFFSVCVSLSQYLNFKYIVKKKLTIHELKYTKQFEFLKDHSQIL